MTPELEQELYAKYPKIFPNGSNTMACEDGWYTLIDTLCKCIQSYIDSDSTVTQVIVQAVKEKFGVLRVYTQGGDAYTHGMTAFAEALSQHTCEICGAPGETTGSSGLATRCENCMHAKSRYIRLEVDDGW